MYKREMETIRSVLRSYIVQIDSLNMQNQELMAENKQLRNTERRLTTEKEQLEKDKSQLGRDQGPGYHPAGIRNKPGAAEQT